MSDLVLYVQALPGSTIGSVVEQMLAMAQRLDIVVQTNFNSIVLMVNGSETVEKIISDYHRGLDVQEARLRRKGKI